MVGEPQESEEHKWKKDRVEAVQEVFSSRSTSLTGTMMTRSNNSMNWDWDNRPWKSMETSSWSYWGISDTSNMIKWKSNVFWVGYLKHTETRLSLMSLELWKRLSGRLNIVEQSKGKLDIHKAWKDKNNEKSNQRTKGFKPSNFRNQQKKPSQAEK